MKNLKLKIGTSGFPVKMSFTTKDTKSTKFGVLIIRKLRVLRGEQSKLNLAHYPHKSPKNLKIKKFCRWDFEFCLELRRRIYGVT
jgi:hypothetical protein